MNDKELILKAISSHGAGIAKVIFPKIPAQAVESLIQIGIKNKIENSQINQVLSFLFDKDDNLPSPQDFWDVFKGVLDDKPFEFTVFNKKVIINGKDVEEIKQNFLNKKNIT